MILRTIVCKVTVYKAYLTRYICCYSLPRTCVYYIFAVNGILPDILLIILLCYLFSYLFNWIRYFVLFFFFYLIYLIRYILGIYNILHIPFIFLLILFP